MPLNIGKFDSLRLSGYLTSNIDRYRFTLSASKSHRVNKGGDGGGTEIAGEF